MVSFPYYSHWSMGFHEDTHLQLQLIFSELSFVSSPASRWPPDLKSSAVSDNLLEAQASHSKTTRFPKDMLGWQTLIHWSSFLDFRKLQQKTSPLQMLNHCFSTPKFTLPFRCRIFVTEAGAKCALVGEDRLPLHPKWIKMNLGGVDHSLRWNKIISGRIPIRIIYFMV